MAATEIGNREAAEVGNGASTYIWNKTATE